MSFGVGNAVDAIAKEAECEETLLAIVKTIVQLDECAFPIEFQRIGEIDAVLLQIGKALGLVPFVFHM